MDLMRQDDRAAVSRMFRLVLDVVAAVAPDLQMISTEYVDINESGHQKAATEIWSGRKKFIHENWLRVGAACSGRGFRMNSQSRSSWRWIALHSQNERNIPRLSAITLGPRRQ